MDNSNGSNNIIGEGSVLKGNLNTSGNVRLEGKVIGDLSSSSKVACGISGLVSFHRGIYRQVIGAFKGPLTGNRGL